jgi:Na+-translocating ferredoxin:NAD+ oxidoreductase RNF subunit RnfB
MTETTIHNPETPQVDPEAYSYDYILPEAAQGLTVLSSSNPPAEEYSKIKLKKKPKSMAVVDEASCVGCEYCVHVCPIPNCLALVSIENDPAQIQTLCVVNENTCIACRNCETACPYDAIHVVKREEAGQWKFSVNLPPIESEIERLARS